MEPPFTRSELQNFNLDAIMRTNAVRQAAESITQMILHAASGSPRRKNTGDWEIVEKKLVINISQFMNGIYQKNPFTGHINKKKPYKDIMPDVVEKLKLSFPDVDFVLDKIGSYLIVDWS
jgi:hypothetical protein